MFDCSQKVFESFQIIGGIIQSRGKFVGTGGVYFSKTVHKRSENEKKIKRNIIIFKDRSKNYKTF